MKKSDLKRIIRPIVEELVEDAIEDVLMKEGYVNSKIQEMILEGNLLKGVVQAVASGLNESNTFSRRSQPVYENRPSPHQEPDMSNLHSIRENMKRRLFAGEDMNQSKKELSLSGLNPENESVKKIVNNESISPYFKGTVSDIPDDSGAASSEASPLDKLAAGANNPELGPPVSSELIKAMLGGGKKK